MVPMSVKTVTRSTKTKSAPTVRCIVYDDRPRGGSLLAPGLKLLGFDVVTAASQTDIQRGEVGGPCVAILSTKKAGKLSEGLRRGGFRGGILVLDGKRDRKREIEVLDAGADDFVGPLDDLQLLRARVEALGRRRERPEGSVYVIGPLRIDESKRRVEVRNRTVRVSQQELALLALLARRRGQPVNRQEILSAWGAPDLLENGVDVCIGRVRRKLGASGRLLRTVRGRGFALVEG